jgi:hypothetical protein
MLYAILKAVISGVLVAAISEVSRRKPGLGGLLASLPLTSLLAMIWLWRDTKDPLRIADQTQSTLLFILPSLPMFLVIPMLLRRGTPFWAAMGAGCVITVLLYLATVWVAGRMGVKV